MLGFPKMYASPKQPNFKAIWETKANFILGKFACERTYVYVWKRQIELRLMAGARGLTQMLQTTGGLIQRGLCQTQFYFPMLKTRRKAPARPMEDVRGWKERGGLTDARSNVEMSGRINCTAIKILRFSDSFFKDEVEPFSLFCSLLHSIFYFFGNYYRPQVHL